MRIFRIRLDVKGSQPQWLQPNLIIVADHISWVDIYVINAVRTARFVAKSGIRAWPIAGWLCEKAGTIFIMRARRNHTASINKVIHEALGARDCVGLFPEGTTSRGDMLRKFRSSLFEPAVANQAPVAPAAIRCRHGDGAMCHEAAYIDDHSFAESLALIIRQRSMIAEITFAETIQSAGKHRRKVTALAENAVARILNVEALSKKFARNSADPPARAADFPEGH